MEMCQCPPIIIIPLCILVNGHSPDIFVTDQMHQICHEARQGNFLSKIQRTVDGVVLESRDERDEDCVITFQTESILEKFLLKFERLQMDCNDHLYIYDGAHVAGPWRVSLMDERMIREGLKIINNNS